MRKIYITLIALSISYMLHGQCIDSTLIDDWYRCEYWKIEADDLVCGCDGITYATADCAAKWYGVANFTPGPCDSCKTDILPNPLNLIDEDTITWANIRPVCGCNNKSYLHPRSALMDGVVKWTDGACSCIDSSVIDLSKQITIYPNLDYVKRVRGCDGNIYWSFLEAYYHHGVTTFFDDFAPCDVDTAIIDPDYPCDTTTSVVCGCDGIEYLNSCVATYQYGITTYYDGPCYCYDSITAQFYTPLPCRSVDFERLSPVCSCDKVTYLYRCEAEHDIGVNIFRSGPCKCIDTTFIDLGKIYPDEELLFCGCDGGIYHNEYEAVFKYGVLGGQACGCMVDQLIDEDKPCSVFDYDPVCGCDTLTYINECIARSKYGINKYRKGTCGNCQEPNLVIPDYPCGTVYNPVCGCDSVTYDNECVARYRYGIMEWTQGACTTGIDREDIGDKISFYPNPTSGILKIEGTSFIDNIEVYNLVGVLVSATSDVLTIDLSEVRNGVYLVKVKLKQGGYLWHRVGKFSDL